MPVADATLVNLWIQDIREVRDAHAAELAALKKTGGADAVWDALVRFNVRRQVFNVATSPIVQRAWAAGQRLALHGAVYSLKDGLLETVTAPLTGRADVEEHAAAGGGAAPGATAALARELRAHLAFEQLVLVARRPLQRGGHLFFVLLLCFFEWNRGMEGSQRWR